jgi:flagellar biosynthesis protein FlhA
VSVLASIGRRLGGVGLGRTALLPLATLSIVGLMVVPIPAFVLDCFFIFNIAVSLAVLMVALKTERPLDFSAFPTVLLFTTMLRLALNVASTRAVLVNGHSGTAVAGHVIEAFGKFLIGGDFIVGLFVFVIITIINLTVITKGAGRVSEVSARFTLDALPGKQMAIDADLNAGVLTADEAKARRADVALEADFYGSMDGASKFTKGDAVAGIFILVVNIIGGLLLGVISHGLSIGDAASHYILLAIGDGLVAQVPALLLSLAAAVIVTRVSSPLDLSEQVLGQFRQPHAWFAVSAILGMLGFLPGMPHLLALGAAGGAGVIAWRMSPRQAPAVPGTTLADDGEATPGEVSIGWEEVTDHAQVGLEIGYGLIELVDQAQRGPLIARVTGVRKQLSRELGFVLPAVRVRDNMDLPPLVYRILIGGAPVGEDEARPGEWLALDPGTAMDPVAGRPVKDPSFGLPALWITPDKRDIAAAAGYTIVDCSTVIATHLAQVLQANAHRLIGQDDVQRLLDTLQNSARALVTGLVPKMLALNVLTAACQALLEDGVPIREFRRVVEAAAAQVHRTSDPVELAELMRPALAELVIARLAGVKEPLRVLTLSDPLEALIATSVRADPGPWPIEPGLARRVAAAAREAASPLNEAGTPFALVVGAAARRPLARLLRHALGGMPVLGYPELPDTKPIRVVGVIGEEAASAAGLAGALAHAA